VRAMAGVGEFARHDAAGVAGADDQGFQSSLPLESRVKH
jgi:hypothetical protein